jgi:hypothetical protein
MVTDPENSVSAVGKTDALLVGIKAYVRHTQYCAVSDSLRKILVGAMATLAMLQVEIIAFACAPELVKFSDKYPNYSIALYGPLFSPFNVLSGHFAISK